MSNKVVKSIVTILAGLLSIITFVATVAYGTFFLVNPYMEQQRTPGFQATVFPKMDEERITYMQNMENGLTFMLGDCSEVQLLHLYSQKYKEDCKNDDAVEMWFAIENIYSKYGINLIFTAFYLFMAWLFTVCIFGKLLVTNVGDRGRTAINENWKEGAVLFRNRACSFSIEKYDMI